MGSNWKALYCKASHQLPWWLWDKHTIPLHGRDQFLDGFQTLMYHREQMPAFLQMYCCGSPSSLLEDQNRSLFLKLWKGKYHVKGSSWNARSQYSSSVLHVVLCYFPQPKGHPATTGLGKHRYEAWDMSSTYTVFPLEIINAALDWDFPAKKSLLITQSNPPDSIKLRLSTCLKTLLSGEASARVLERQLVHM